MRIENRELLGILVKDVFGSITLNLERWDGLGNAQFSIGRTYFNDRLKRSVPLNSAAAEKLLALYRHALTEGSGCGYDAKKTSRKICETLESLVPGEDFRFLVFLFSDKDKVRSNKLEGILSVLALLLSMAENKETLELEKFRESYTQELKLEISKCLACFPTLVSEGATGTPKGLEPNQHHAGLPVVQTPVQTKRETSFPYSGQSPVNTERLIGSVVYPDANFVGREAELDQIHRVLTSPNNKLFLSGMGGIGKSELARQYIHRHRDDYRLILWISASGTLVHTLADDFLLPIRGLSRLDYPNDSEEDYFRRKCILLRELADADVLVVLDNYDTEDDAGLWDFLGGSYTGIITTRVTRREPRLQEMRIRPIQEMVELRDIFQRIYTRNLDAGEMEGLDRLISMLGGHTLSVRIVASILRTRRISPSRMADLLSQRFQEADGSVKKAGTEIHRAIREIFTIANLSGEEKFLLKNLACIPLCGINAEDLFKWCAFEDYDVLEGLIRKNLVMHLPNTDEVFLHPVITSVAQEMLAEDDKDVETLVRNFCLLAVHLKRGLLSEKERYLSFAEHMVSIPFSNAGNRVDSLIALGYYV